jgi:hypothetical protein
MIFPPLFPPPHILFLVALQLDRIFLMGVLVVAVLGVFGEGLKVGFAFILKDALNGQFVVIEGGQFLAELDVDGRGMRFVGRLVERFLGRVLLYAFSHLTII